jgi:hypothetical protein
VNASIAIPSTIQIRRSRLAALIVAAAALAAAVTWALLAFAFDDGRTKAASILQAGAAAAPVSSVRADARRVPSIMSLTPARLAAGALGTGYALPTTAKGPTVASVLSLMSPQTRRYTEAVMSLTFAQLAAGGAGQP